MKSNAKTRLVSYILWFLLGGFGAHRFYLKRIKSGFILLTYTVVTSLIDFFALDFFPGARALLPGDLFYWITSIPLWIFLLYDAFQIPGWVDELNNEGRGTSVFD